MSINCVTNSTGNFFSLNKYRKVIIIYTAFLTFQLSVLLAQNTHEEYLKKADMGDLESMRYVAFVYTVQKNYPESFKWYKKGAILGDAASQNSLGNRYEKGLGVEKDIDQAVRWYKASAEQNNTMGLISLGECYRHGRGIEKDEVRAAQLFALAHQLGDINGTSSLGALYMVQEHEKSKKGEIADYTNGLALIKYAAEKNNVRGLKVLGASYMLAVGVPQDYQEAIILFQKAAELGSDDVFFGLGFCHEKLYQFTESYMWYNIGEYFGNKECSSKKQSIGFIISGERVGEAQKKSRAWLAEFRDEQ